MLGVGSGTGCVLGLFVCLFLRFVGWLVGWSAGWDELGVGCWGGWGPLPTFHLALPPPGLGGCQAVGQEEDAGPQDLVPEGLPAHARAAEGGDPPRHVHLDAHLLFLFMHEGCVCVWGG